MMSRQRTLILLPFLLLLLLHQGVSPSLAQTAGQVITSQGTYTSPAEALALAQDGDTIDVYGGVFGSLIIDRPVTLVGHDWPVFDGNGQGTVLRITAPDVTLRGFVIRNGGDSLNEENSSVAVEAPRAVVEHNRLEDALFGIYLREASGSVIRDNVISSKDLPLPRRGDAIRIWYSNDVRVENNVVSRGRDVVLWYSNNLIVRGNEVSFGRYGLHFMYCDDATIEQNVLTNNSVGTFLMYSRRLHMLNNTVAYNRGPSGFGVGLKDMDDAVIEDNLFLDNRIGAFLDNSPRQVNSIGRFEGNVFAYNDIGVDLMPSVRHNQFSANTFVDNGQQVSISGGGGGRLQDNDWTPEEVGNYWSDYVGYDANMDGLGDIPYKSERLFENLMDNNSALRLFVYSPVEQAIDFASRAVPFVKPQPKLSDQLPLMSPRLPDNLPPLPSQEKGSLWQSAMGLLLIALAIWTFGNGRSRERYPRGGGVDAVDTIPSVRATWNQEKLMIQVKNLNKWFGDTKAVDDLTFDIRAGEAVALWGSNGAGKTTALRCILGVMPYEGSVTLGEHDVSWQGKAARRLLGFVPQEISLHDDLTVEDTLRFYGRLKKVPANGENAARLLERLGLSSYTAKAVRDLSGGMKQRLALAIALLADPPVLILDEPTANLDVKARGEFLGLLAELKVAGKTLLFSSHRLEEVAAIADRVLLMEAGRLAADCPPAELGSKLGSSALLKLHLDEEWIETAVTTLTHNGFAANRNGKGIWVRVIPLEKARPISVLAEAGIPVDDFEVE